MTNIQFNVLVVIVKFIYNYWLSNTNFDYNNKECSITNNSNRKSIVNNNNVINN